MSSRTTIFPSHNDDLEFLKNLLQNLRLSMEEYLDFLLPLFFSSPTDREISKIKNSRVNYGNSLEQLKTVFQSIPKLLQDVPSLLVEMLFSDSELKRHGIVHTPPWVARMMTALTVSGNERVILDPACGTGVFLHSLLEHPRVNQSFILGIEQNSRIAQVARKRISLLMKTPMIHEQKHQLKVRVTVSDFFDFLANNKKEVIGKTDLVIGNPPYVRQEFVANKQHLATMIEELSEIPIKIDKKSDLYVYFLHACLNVLSEEGKLCLLIPDKWMTARYGRSVKKTLLTLQGRTTIIFLHRNIFPSIDVRPIILIFEKNSRLGTGAKNNAQIQIIKDINTLVREKILSCLTTSDKNNHQQIRKLLFGNNYIHVIDRNSLQGHNKWLMAINAPKFFLRILKHQKTLPLHNNIFSTVQYGNKTGANDFFFLTSNDLKTWNIPTDYLTPAIKSVKGIQGNTLTNPDSWLLHVPHHLGKEMILNSSSLKEYIEWGMAEPRMFQRRPSCYKSRNPPRLHEKCKQCQIKQVKNLCDGCRWFSLSLKPPPDFLLGKVNHINVLPVYNSIKAHPSDSIQCIHVLDENQRDFLHACLSSRIMQLAMELMGRWEGGGALTLMVEDTRTLPILNPFKITPEERYNIIQAARELFKEKERNTSSCRMVDALQDELDLSILKAWNEPAKTLEDLKNSITQLQKRRLERN